MQKAIHDEMEVIILPGISAFVGADIVAGMYDCDMDLKENPHMLLDVGTNGEMVIGDKNGFLATATAAGPVFEGGKIRYGSELIAMAARLLEKQIIDENGTFCDEYFESGYPVKPAGQEEVRLTQSDIRELQMGKAAIRAGMDILLQKVKAKKIYLAGGMGNAIDPKAAVSIGLFSEDCVNLIEPVGNAALEGAHKLLLDENGEERVQKIVENAREMNLANERDFEEKYIHFMQFLV